jgi:hypothetical protein
VRECACVRASVLILFSLILPVAAVQAVAIIADHDAAIEFYLISDSVISEIGESYHIFYVHTSHGSQIITGIGLLEAEDPSLAPPPFLELSDDLGAEGDTSWAPQTRYYLEHPSYDFNMAMFSWCGGVSSTSEQGIDIYLAKMEELEADYPGVTFIYMTGHLDGTGPGGNLYLRNNQIRDYCSSHDKMLFDFADIESYEPDGIYYPDESDACNWCYDWCAAHDCPSCGCAHSHCQNCYLKGKAWWWMMARVAGWNPDYDPSCGDADGNGLVNVSDAVHFIGYIFGGGSPPDPIEMGDVDCNMMVNISDAVYLIAYIFGGGGEPCELCP